MICLLHKVRQERNDKLMLTLEEVFNDINVPFTVDENGAYQIGDTTKYIKIRTLDESVDAFRNEKKRFYNMHFKYKDEGKQLIYLEEFALEEPTVTDFTKPFIMMFFNGSPKRVFYARQVVCKEATRPKDRRTLSAFIKRYHLQQQVGARYYYGFYSKKNDELLGVMTFGKNLNPKYQKDERLMELKRMVWLPDVQVRYGLSKGIQTLFKTHPEFDKVLSYSLNDISNGNAYEKAGFELAAHSNPGTRFKNPNDLLDNYSFQIKSSWGARTGVIAKRIHPFPKEQCTSQFLEELIETELPHRSDDGKGYLPTVDSGNDTWIYYKNK